MEQLQARQKELDDAWLQMELEQTVLDHVIAHNVQRRIAGDDGGLSCFTCASQNIAAAAAMF